MIPFSAYFVPRHREGGTERGDQAAAKPDFEYLYDKAYEDRGIVRIAGPFTVEGLAPRRTLGVDEIDALIDHLAERKAGYDGQQDFATMILEHLNKSGIQQAHHRCGRVDGRRGADHHQDGRISSTALTPWPNDAHLRRGPIRRA